MMNNPIHKNILAIIILVILVIATACQDDFLDKKPDKSLVIPSSLDDFQAILDNSAVMNYEPALGLLGADNYYLTDNLWQSLYTSTERNSYIWAKEVYEGEPLPDWNAPYRQVFYANVVLEGLEKLAVEEKDREEWNRLKGSALFYRANAFYQLAQLFAPAYSELTANEQGIPLRLSPDINALVSRADLQETYDRIIQDLTEAMELLPEHLVYQTRPYQPTVHALLARVYLNMGAYESAAQHAGRCLQLDNTLIDYNDLDTNALRPVPLLNEEVIFHSLLISYSVKNSAHIDTMLYKSYSDNDLRKAIFFNKTTDGGISFGGTYTGGISLFGGIATDEVYLIRAECFARMGQTEAAMNDLNVLLEKRWKSGTFVPFQADDANEALKLVLEERRKELVFRGMRWNDLRRLNREQAFAKVLTRELNGETYVLPPGDARYTYPIPELEIELGGIEQNPR